MEKLKLMQTQIEFLHKQLRKTKAFYKKSSSLFKYLYKNLLSSLQQINNGNLFNEIDYINISNYNIIEFFIININNQSEIHKKIHMFLKEEGNKLKEQEKNISLMLNQINKSNKNNNKYNYDDLNQIFLNSTSIIFDIKNSIKESFDKYIESLCTFAETKNKMENIKNEINKENNKNINDKFSFIFNNNIKENNNLTNIDNKSDNNNDKKYNNNQNEIINTETNKKSTEIKFSDLLNTSSNQSKLNKHISSNSFIYMKHLNNNNNNSLPLSEGINNNNKSNNINQNIFNQKTISLNYKKHNKSSNNLKINTSKINNYNYKNNIDNNINISNDYEYSQDRIDKVDHFFSSAINNRINKNNKKNNINSKNLKKSNNNNLKSDSTIIENPEIIYINSCDISQIPNNNNNNNIFSSFKPNIIKDIKNDNNKSEDSGIYINNCDNNNNNQYFDTVNKNEENINNSNEIK